MKKIAQAGTLERLTKFLNEYCYSTTYNINEDFTITNSKGVSTLFKVEKNSKGAFILYLNT